MPSSAWGSAIGTASRLAEADLVAGAATQTGSPSVQVVGWTFLAVAVVCASAITADIIRGYRQHMAIMNLVWPITALYLGPIAVWGYLARGRRMSRRWAHEHGHDMREVMSDAERDPRWWQVSKATTHCGAGCTLGDIAGEWLLFATGWAIGFVASREVNVLLTAYIFDFAFAWSLGILFQYFSIVPMRDDVGRLEGIWLAIKADTLSIVAFQVGLFSYMAVYHLVLWNPPLAVDSPAYWWQMQIGMAVGFLTSWPVNAWLLRKGWKERM